MSDTKFIVQTLLFPAIKVLIGSEVDKIVSDSLKFVQRLLHRMLVENVVILIFLNILMALGDL